MHPEIFGSKGCISFLPPAVPGVQQGSSASGYAHKWLRLRVLRMERMDGMERMEGMEGMERMPSMGGERVVYFDPSIEQFRSGKSFAVWHDEQPCHGLKHHMTRVRQDRHYFLKILDSAMCVPSYD